jgi:hypothetical protein
MEELVSAIFAALLVSASVFLQGCTTKDESYMQTKTMALETVDKPSTVTITATFPEDSLVGSGEGKTFFVYERTTGKLVTQGTLDKDGKASVNLPRGLYQITMNGAPKITTTQTPN